jgi:glucose-1-phosphatase
MAIKNLLFDLGGVLLNINYHKTREAFEQLGYHDFDKMYSQYSVDELFENLEIGKVSNEDFYHKMRQANANQLSDEQISKAWNSMLLDFRKESLAFLKTLSEKYNVFLFSNTNAIHLQAFKKILKEDTGEELDDFFKKAYYSHLINLRKPNKNAFEFILKDAGIAAEETLFIDDSYPNIEAAAALGLKTHLLLPEERIENLPGL